MDGKIFSSKYYYAIDRYGSNVNFFLPLALNLNRTCCLHGGGTFWQELSWLR